jgi:hypothetical protein
MDDISHLKGYSLILRFEFFDVDPSVLFPAGYEGLNP